MQSHLNPLLDRLGLRAKPRYSLEETADIIGIRRDQVLDLLKRGKLIGVRASDRRWGGIIAADLDDSRNRAFGDALDRKGLHFVRPPEAPADVVATQRRMIAVQLAEVDSTVSGYSAARSSALADAQAADAQRRKFDATLPILDHELDAMNALDTKGYAPRLRLLAPGTPAATR